MNYKSVIGLEIHAELSTNSKVYCSCKNEFGNKTNLNTCPQCTAMPGSLPVINQNAVKLSIMAGLCFDCKINNYSSFDRKNYFYPDSPKAYQITQFFNPICSDGLIRINEKNIRIERIHLEEDAGKLIHDDSSTFIDFNRCGVGLIEIVTKPDFETGDEVVAFLEEIALRLKYAKICDAKLEEGSLRVDVNISVMPENSNVLGTRAEIKNLNSYKSIKKAIEYEFERQRNLIVNGEKVICQTRRFDENTQTTVPLRKKESVDDYRYFPEPDLPYIYISDNEISEIKKEIPKLPHIRFDEYVNQHQLPVYDAKLLVADINYSDFYNSVIDEFANYKEVSNMILGELTRNLNENNINISQIPFSPKDFSELLKMQSDGTVTRNAAKKILSLMFKSENSPENIAKEHGLLSSNDTKIIENAVAEVISENHNSILSYKNGNEKLFSFFIGQVMRKTKGSQDPVMVKNILSEMIDKYS